MTKPILWLGPIEDVDADFDPLLGRSAKAAAAPVAFSPPSTLSPDRSVFDDPDMLAPATQDGAPPAFESAPEPLPETIAVTDTAPLEDAAPAPSEAASIWDDPAQGDDNAPIDYSHNNEPIPERLTPPSQDVSLPEAAMEAEPVASTKSFFTRLFTAKPIAAAAGAAGVVAATATTIVPKPDAEDDDIWSRIEADTAPPTDAKQDGAIEVLAEAVVPDEAADLQSDSPLESTDWPDAEIDVPPEPVQADVADQAHEEVLEDADVALTQTLDDTLPEPEPTEEPTLEPVIVAQEEPASDTPSPPDPEVAATLDAPIEEPPEEQAEVPIADAPSAAQSAPTTEHPFSRAFNADQFWSVKQSTDDALQSTGVVSSIEDLDPPTPEEVPAPEPVSTIIASTEDAASPLQVGADDRPLQRNDDSFSAPSDQEDAPVLAKPSGAMRGQRRKKRVKKNYVGAFFGTFLFGVTVIMTLVSSAAALGYPFDLISSYRWYWVIMGVVSAGIWGLSRGWKMVIASFVVSALNLMVTVPASGNAPVGGKMAAAVIGWANVKNNPEALTRVIKDAETKGATLVMLAEAPQAVFTPPAGWTLIEAPVANDPTAIAVLSKGSWRAVTVPGEPTMAAPPARDITIIGVHPQDAHKGRRSTPVRDALINRAGARAGIQEGPTVVLGDFNAAPWDRAMRQFREYGKVTRVRCGGWVGGTYSQAFGLIGVATDHAYVRDVKVTHCKVGATLPGGHHKPIWLYVAPQAAAPAPTPQ
jgi:hypothetical protein